jgi:hypothetical protein
MTGNPPSLQPGYYPNGITQSGQTQLVLQPGIYYLNGDLTITGQAGITVATGPNMVTSPDTGTGVLIYQSTGTTKIAGNGAVSLTPPDTGTYNGITYFQARNNTNTVEVDGNGSTQITGTIYASSALMKVVGNGGLDGTGNPLDTIGNQYISNTLTVSGNGGFNVAYNPQNTINVRIINLVE